MWFKLLYVYNEEAHTKGAHVCMSQLSETWRSVRGIFMTDGLSTHKYYTCTSSCFHYILPASPHNTRTDPFKVMILAWCIMVTWTRYKVCQSAKWYIVPDTSDYKTYGVWWIDLSRDQDIHLVFTLCIPHSITLEIPLWFSMIYLRGKCAKMYNMYIYIYIS